MNTDPDLYAGEGYCVFPDILDDDTVASSQLSLDAMIAELPPNRRLESLVEPHVRAKDWQFWLSLARRPLFLDAVASCLGTDELLLLSTHLLVKQPRDGLAVKWHQDNTYWPSVTGSDVCTLWLALEEVDRENSCMMMVPRTQHGHVEMEMQPTDGTDLLGISVTVSDEQARRAVPIELSAGGASVHDSFIIHGSGPNKSVRRRAAWTLRYANAETVEVNLDVHRKPVYYVSGSGLGLKPGFRDITRGKPLPDHPGEHLSKRFES